MRPIHDRMPVLLEESEERRWLEDDDSDELKAMLNPHPNDNFNAFEISTTVNNPANDSPAVVEPTG